MTIQNNRPRQPVGLYRPEFEHDACGVGFIARTTGQPGHDIIEMALEAVSCMKHRSGIDADGLSGDGAGILTQIPHRLLASEIDDLPAPGDYAVGIFFLPLDNQQSKIENRKSKIDEGVGLIEKVISQNIDQPNITWRDLPVNPDVLGSTAQRTRPEIKQLIITRPARIEPGEPFERFLFMLRKQIEVAGRKTTYADEFFVVSLSSQTVTYKGLMLSPYLADFYLDLKNPLFEAAIAVLHARYSTNTSPVWKRAQPTRMAAHNGEINTVQGNVNWMKARESNIGSPYWPNLDELRPIIDPEGTDSAMLDNVLELLTRAGRDIHHSMAMLMPTSWENLTELHPEIQAFYRYHAALMEPWDGPAAVVFTDGRKVGATLDRIGLRPMRYAVTDTDLVIANSEAGAVLVDEGTIISKGKLGPGEMIVVDLDQQIFLTNSQVKKDLSRRAPYAEWIEGFKPFPTETRPAYFSAKVSHHRPAPPKVNTTPQWLARLQAAFGYTREEMTIIMRPMAFEGKEPTGSMGDDTPAAVMSDQPRPLFHYFKQRFAQVTNPPIDPLRETMVMSLTSRLGSRPNLLEETAKHAHQIELTSPVLGDGDFLALKGLGDPRFRTHTIPMRYPVEQGVNGLRRALNRLCTMAEQAIEDGSTVIILSDLGIDEHHAPIPSMLAVGAVHHHLVRKAKRMRVSLVVETGEVREVHHLACLVGYGANAVNPYLALATVESLTSTGRFEMPADKAKKNFIRALEAGLLKIMSKMGISTAESYCGAQIFEAIGLSQELIDEYFAGTVSRLGGIGLKEIAREVRRWHDAGYLNPQRPDITSPGFYKYRRKGEKHTFTPLSVTMFHKAVRLKGVLNEAASKSLEQYDQHHLSRKSFFGEKFAEGFKIYKEFIKLTGDGAKITPRDLFEFDSPQEPIDISEVEPVENIFARLSTGAMSHGALSSEVHETLAIGMNRIGATSNSGEGGQAQYRFGNERNDGIKQVASGRFGVTPAYLVSAHELQIKMAQGAKPGEGGQLPGHKVSDEIASIRHTTKGTTLISPPPHHDIYSIEDLAQLIYDLKQVNPPGDVSVKLVSEAGVGTVAAGVSKGGADVVHIAGHNGGTGASPWSSVKNAGMPWEIGLAEAHQTLTLNNLRERIRVRTDGGIQNGRDIVIAAILGADEYSFGTMALMAEGCIMARVCHNNTCPVGVTTQREILRKKFTGLPEHIITYMHYVAEEVREILAQLGFRSLGEIIGRTELLKQIKTGNKAIDSLDLSPLLVKTSPPEGAPPVIKMVSYVPVNELNQQLLSQAQPAVETGEPVQLTLPINNTDRAVGSTLSGEIAKRYGDKGLPEGTISVTFHGSAGQSLGAFNVTGLNLTLIGEANDYVGKGMNGGQIVVRPPLKSRLIASDNTIVGNTLLYGATGGALFANGQAGERFAVRNSGATAVVEGLGDHGCEYMTGGIVIVLGRTGYNFGAGMSGGMAFVLDEGHHLPQRLNSDMVEMARITNEPDITLLRHLITRHVRLTGSVRGQAILDNWTTQLGLFWKVAPHGTIGSTGVRPEVKVALPMPELSQHVAA